MDSYSCNDTSGMDALGYLIDPLVDLIVRLTEWISELRAKKERMKTIEMAKIDFDDNRFRNTDSI